MISKEAEISIAASSIFPGFRFSPTDEELLLYYLKKKFDGFHKCVEVIAEVDICKFEPWDLPAKSIIQSDCEWFFFSPRGRKYPNGSQSKRATEVGYWKATGKERDVKSGSEIIGTKRTLVFHLGRAPKGDRTEWIMHEYCMSGKSHDSLVVCRLRKKADFHSGEVSNYEPVSRAGSATTGICAVFGSDQTQSDRAAEEASKKCSTSSYGSHSIEQMDCVSHSDKLRDHETVKPESSNAHKHHQEADGEIDGEMDGKTDDCFAEIMKDNIVDLGSPSTAPPPSLQLRVPDRKFAERSKHGQPPGQSLLSRVYPMQGTASRRIRLNKVRKRAPGTMESRQIEDDHRDENGGAEQLARSSRLSLKCKVNRLYVVVTVMMMLLVFCISFLGTWNVKMSSYGVSP